MKRMHLWSDGVYHDRPEPGVIRARDMVLTALDEHGQPVPGTTVHMRGPVFLHLADGDGGCSYAPGAV